MNKIRKKSKTIAVTGCLLLSFLMIGCGKKDDSTQMAEQVMVFPKDYQLAGVNIGGMSAEEAKDAVFAVNTNYDLAVTINGTGVKIPTADIGFEIRKDADFEKILKAATGDSQNEVGEKTGDTKNDLAGIQTDGDQGETVFEIFNDKLLEDKIRTSYKKQLNVNLVAVQSLINQTAEDAQSGTQDEDIELQNAKATFAGKSAEELQAKATELTDELSRVNANNAAVVEYNVDSSAFEVRDGEAAEVMDYAEVMEAVKTALSTGRETADASAGMKYTEGEKAADSETAQSLIASAEEFVKTDVKVLFELAGKESTTVEVDRNTKAGWLSLNVAENEVSINDELLSTYLNSIAEEHNHTTKVRQLFKSTSGGDIPVSSLAGGDVVDANRLYEDVRNAFENKVSGTVSAVYKKISDEETEKYTNFGGTYVELDLANQRAYVYQDNVCVVNTPVVTGNVSKGWGTPRGIYSIFAKNRNRYLNGPDYRTWVDYFCPFNGGIGFHDASWRGPDDFGHDYYLYNGSHGCVNMPYDAVKKLYSVVSVGTKVVVYGSVPNVSGPKPEWSGTGNYSVVAGSEAFRLDTSCTRASSLSYSSNNSSVASVDSNGVVTAQGVGSCAITVSMSPESDSIQIDPFVVYVEVTAPKPVQYTVSVNRTGEGSVSASTASAAAGTKVILYATPAEGYRFVRWEGVGVDAENSFVMPGTNVAATAVFEKIEVEAPPASTQAEQPVPEPAGTQATEPQL